MFAFGGETVATDVGSAYVGIDDAALAQRPEVAGAPTHFDQPVLGDEGSQHAFGIPEVSEFGRSMTEHPDEAALVDQFLLLAFEPRLEVGRATGRGTRSLAHR